MPPSTFYSHTCLHTSVSSVSSYGWHRYTLQENSLSLNFSHVNSSKWFTAIYGVSNCHYDRLLNTFLYTFNFSLSQIQTLQHWFEPPLDKRNKTKQKSSQIKFRMAATLQNRFNISRYEYFSWLPVLYFCPLNFF